MNLGATLIERMLVICILWILTWMCFPNLSDALARALWARDKANERIATMEAEVQRLRGETPAGTAATPAAVVTGSATGIPTPYQALLSVGARQLPHQ